MSEDRHCTAVGKTLNQLWGVVNWVELSLSLQRGLLMIRKVQINNYKSIPDLTLDLGRITVLIGANGSGKSNILEAIAVASAAAQQKLDNEFLTSRGIRVTETRFMRSAFQELPPPRKALQVSSQNGSEPTLEERRIPRTSIKISVMGTTRSHSIVNYPPMRRRPIPNGSSEHR